MIKIVKDEKDFDTSNGIVVVDYYADWCGPCKMMTPVLEELTATYPEVTVMKVDTESLKELANKNDIQNIPTLDIFENGVKKTRKVGYLPKKLLLDSLEANTSFKVKI